MDVRLSVFVATILVAGLPVGPAFGEGAWSDSSAYQYSQPIEPTFYHDISYATLSPSQKLDLYLPPAQDRPAPVVIWVSRRARSKSRRQALHATTQFRPPTHAKRTRWALSNPGAGCRRANPQRLCGREFSTTGFFAAPATPLSTSASAVR